MKAVIYGDALVQPLTGIGVYTLQLLRHLTPLVGEDDLMVLKWGRLHHPRDVLDAMAPTPQRNKENTSRLKACISQALLIARQKFAGLSGVSAAYYWLSRLISSYALRNYESQDVLLAPNFLMVKFPGKQIVTVADLSTEKHPDCHPKPRVRMINRAIREAAKRADHIITFSDYVRRELLALYHLPESRVSVTYLGADETYRPYSDKELEAVLMPLSLEKGAYFLSSCTLEPRKNLDRVLTAYQGYRDVVGGESAHPLVLVGHPGWKSQALFQRIEKLGSASGVRYLGYVKQSQLPRLMCGARALIYMSFYEGFGLPVLEAIRAGTQVITSNDTSMSEFGSPPALLADPGSAGSIVKRLIEVHQNRSAMAPAMNAAIHQATWEECAQRTLRIMKAISSNPDSLER